MSRFIPAIQLGAAVIVTAGLAWTVAEAHWAVKIVFFTAVCASSFLLGNYHYKKFFKRR